MAGVGLIGGSVGSGKTETLLRIATEARKAGPKVAYADLPNYEGSPVTRAGHRSAAPKLRLELFFRLYRGQWDTGNTVTADFALQVPAC